MSTRGRAVELETDKSEAFWSNTGGEILSGNSPTVPRVLAPLDTPFQTPLSSVYLLNAMCYPHERKPKGVVSATPQCAMSILYLLMHHGLLMLIVVGTRCLSSLTGSK